MLLDWNRSPSRPHPAPPSTCTGVAFFPLSKNSFLPCCRKHTQALPPLATIFIPHSPLSRTEHIVLAQFLSTPPSLPNSTPPPPPLCLLQQFRAVAVITLCTGGILLATGCPSFSRTRNHFLAKACRPQQIAVNKSREEGTLSTTRPPPPTTTPPPHRLTTRHHDGVGVPRTNVAPANPLSPQVPGALPSSTHSSDSPESNSSPVCLKKKKRKSEPMLAVPSSFADKPCLPNRQTPSLSPSHPPPPPPLYFHLVYFSPLQPLKASLGSGTVSFICHYLCPLPPPRSSFSRLLMPAPILFIAARCPLPTMQTIPILLPPPPPTIPPSIREPIQLFPRPPSPSQVLLVLYF